MGLCVSGERTDFELILRYEGQKFLGVRHGEGTYLYQNGDIYTGQWKWNLKHGHGVLTRKNGEVKQGFFYCNEYIGTDPGNLFTATTCCCLGEVSSAQPLENEEGEIRNQERHESARQRAEENRSRREENKKRRDKEVEEIRMNVLKREAKAN